MREIRSTLKLYRSRSLYCGWTGRPVRVRRHSTLVIGIRNSRAHGCLMDTPSLSGGTGWKMSLDLVSLWEAVTEIVHCT